MFSKMKGSILIVDDDQTSNFVTSMIIRRVRPDTAIDTVLNGLEAVKFFKEKSESLPEYVLLDINMPEMNGFEFLAWLEGAEVLRKPKIIMYTSSVRDEDRLEAKKHQDVIAYVEKPLNNEIFESILKREEP